MAGSNLVTAVTTARVVVGGAAGEDKVGVSIAIVAWLGLVHPGFVVRNCDRLKSELFANQLGNPVNFLRTGNLEGDAVNRCVLSLEVVGRNVIHGVVVVAIQGGNVIDRDIGLHPVANRIHDLVSGTDGTGLLELGDDTGQDLLLPFLATVIVVRVLVTHPGIL